MTYNSTLHHRRSIRLKNYDYSQNGMYFVTICTQGWKCLFGKVAENDKGEMICVLNKVGKIAHDEIQKTEQIRDNVRIDCFIVMPNHIHAIIVINNPSVGAYGNTSVGAYGNTPLQGSNTPLQKQTKSKFQSPSKNLGAIIRGYKSTVTKQINELQNTPGTTIWQRNYYEHIIRNEKSLKKIRNYIFHNAVKWKKDKFYKKQNV